MDERYIDALEASGLSRRPPWMFVTSPELAKALGVHIQTLSNWRLRGVGPPAAPEEWFRGRASRYQIGHVLGWANAKAGRIVSPWELNAEWLNEHMPSDSWSDPEAVQQHVSRLMKLAREFKPADLTFQGREGLAI